MSGYTRLFEAPDYGPECPYNQICEGINDPCVPCPARPDCKAEGTTCDERERWEAEHPAYVGDCADVCQHLQAIIERGREAEADARLD